MSSRVFEKFLILIPNVHLTEPLTIEDFSFKQAEPQEIEEGDSLEEKDLLNETIKMLQNEGLSSYGFFVYCFFDFNTLNRNKISLRMRKAMALLRFATFEEKPELKVEDIPYFVFRVSKMDNDIPEMLYYFHDVLGGPQLFAPGFSETQYPVNHPIHLNVTSNHDLIKKYNENELEDKYISAIEWFNRTFEQGSDNTEDIMKLAVAFEKIHPLGGDKEKEFSCWIYEKFNSEIARKWAKEFYITRGVILHGNEFADYPRDREEIIKQKPKVCIYWRNPEGYTDYTTHAFIGQEIFKFVLRDEVLGEKLENEILDKKIRSQFIDNLLVPNEVCYKQLQQLINGSTKFGDKHFEIISKLSYKDFTGDKKTVYSLLEYYLEKLDELVPTLKDKITAIIDLIQEDNRKLFRELSRLSREIKNYYSKRKNHILLDEKTIKLHHLSRFFEITSRAFSRLLWFGG